MTFDPNRLIALIGKQAAEIEALRIALKRLLLNYSAALPDGKKDQRSITEARKLLGIDEQQEDSICAACGSTRREHQPGGTRWGPTSLCGVFIPEQSTPEHYND